MDRAVPHLFFFRRKSALLMLTRYTTGLVVIRPGNFSRTMSTLHVRVSVRVRVRVRVTVTVTIRLGVGGGVSKP